MPKSGDVVAGKYVVDQLLGEGGMGAVFSATHRFTGKQVALKWMLPELARDEDAVNRFMREAQAAGRINHPNVVDVYDVGQHEDSFFLVMELLRGEPLTSALSRRDLTVREVLDLMLRAMRGVAAAHRQGVVHRDLKPDNIFLAYEEDGVRREPKVLDFGISKLSNEGQINPRLTRTGAVVGTPYYMSPEQIRGSDNLDRRADVYSFGVILYEALTGQVPFIADTYGALVLEIATGTPKSPSELVPGLPEELSRLVLKAMARNAPDRFQDMESLIHALEPFLNDAVQARDLTPTTAQRRLFGAGTNAMSTPFTAEPPPGPTIPRGGKSAVMFVAGALALVVLIWFALQQARSPELPVVAPATNATTTTVNAAQQPPAAATPVTPPPAPPPYVPPPAFMQEKPQPQAEAAKPKSKWHRRAEANEASDAPPATVEREQRPQEKPQTGRRARSGPLSVDEF
ncbi:MAG TPA: serine/threonine-protein kinase [Polyangiales bacterium]|nr:serine/threonine-protein kinase [Polyangiales bacterium]